LHIVYSIKMDPIFVCGLPVAAAVGYGAGRIPDIHPGVGAAACIVGVLAAAIGAFLSSSEPLAGKALIEGGLYVGVFGGAALVGERQVLHR
jgi:hypothetical protein